MKGKIFFKFLTVMGTLIWIELLIIYFILEDASDKIAINMGGLVIGSFCILTLIFLLSVSILAVILLKRLRKIKEKQDDVDKVENQKNKSKEIRDLDHIFWIFGTIYFYILLLLIPLWIWGLIVIPYPANNYDWIVIISASIIILTIFILVIWWIIKDRKSFKQMLLFNISNKPNKMEKDAHRN